MMFTHPRYVKKIVDGEHKQTCRGNAMEISQILQKYKIIDTYMESFIYKCEIQPKMYRAKLKQPTIFFLNMFIT